MQGLSQIHAMNHQAAERAMRGADGRVVVQTFTGLNVTAHDSFYTLAEAEACVSQATSQIGESRSIVVQLAA